MGETIKSQCKAGFRITTSHSSLRGIRASGNFATSEPRGPLTENCPFGPLFLTPNFDITLLIGRSFRFVSYLGRSMSRQEFSGMKTLPLNYPRVEPRANSFQAWILVSALRSSRLFA
jgi:hypothetical protein